MVDKEKLKLAGWIKTNSAQLFDQFSQARKFSFKNDWIIVPPSDAIIYSFEYRRGTTAGEPQLEYMARRIIIDCFREHYPNETCTFVDVNHACYEFVPGKLNLNEACEPWPYAIVPGSAYIAINNSSFSTGTFSDWRSLGLMIYGQPLVQRMIDSFPMPYEVLRKI